MSFEVHTDGLRFSTKPKALEENALEAEFLVDFKKIEVTESQGYYLWSYKGQITEEQALIASKKYRDEMLGVPLVYGKLYEFTSNNGTTTWKEWRADPNKISFKDVRTGIRSGYFWWTYQGILTIDQAYYAQCQYGMGIYGFKFYKENGQKTEWVSSGDLNSFWDPEDEDKHWAEKEKKKVPLTQWNDRLVAYEPEDDPYWKSAEKIGLKMNIIHNGC